jgi:quercetin dioxygenase-like cupin family protein
MAHLYHRAMDAPTRSGSFADLAAATPYPGIRRRTVHSGRATVTEYTFDPGATFPRHRHPQEQVTLVEGGEVRLTADGATEVLRPGAWSIIDGGVEHGVTAGPAGARIVAVLSPRRDDDADLVVTAPPGAAD